VSRVIWSPQALHDLESIRDFIARDSPRYAGLVIQRLVASVDRLGVFPKSGRVVPELGRRDVREVIQPPFRIVYRLPGEGVEVATVFRSSRLFRVAE
jgi:plasmid stabilization system protein ParE